MTKVGFLGTGYMAGVHANNLKKLPGVEITAVFDADNERAERFRADMGLAGAAVYATFDEMIAASGIDALYICIPPFAHNGQFEAAAAKGIHIFIEKPIALDTRRGESMAHAAKAAGIKTHVGYHMRYGGAVQKLKAMIADSTAGLPTLFDAKYECNSLHAPWWRDVEKSGGQLFEQIIHLYDMAMYLLGTPARVTGYTANLCHRDVPGYTAEDTSVSAAGFTSGAVASISASNCAVPSRWRYEFNVVCKNVSVFFKNENEADFVYTAGGKADTETFRADQNAYFEETKAFIRAINGEQAPLASIDEGLASLRYVELVVKSAGSQSAAVDY